MRERNPFGSEARALGEFEHELFELEARPATPATRTVILVSGLEFPRYKKDKPGVWWVANHLAPERHRKSPGALSFGKCLPPAEVGLKYAGNVLIGSDWRLRALRVAVQMLTKDPSRQVFLFDLDRGTEERVLLQARTLSTTVLRQFLAPLDADYRLVVKAGSTATLKAIEKRLAVKTNLAQPGIRLVPFVSEIGTGPVELEAWHQQRAHNATWLADYEKRPDSSRLLSILDVYRRIEDIGRQAPYTLEELQLWGHASSSAFGSNSGTAFANTDHVGVPGRQDWQRHPLDLDARATRDFEHRTINQRLFRMAFARGAMTIVWGCNWSREYFDILNQVIQQLGGRPLDDRTQFVFSWRKGTGGNVGWFQRIMELPVDLKTETKNIKKDGKFVRGMVIGHLKETYMQQIANLTSRCAVGGVPGVGSDYDERSEKKAPCLSNIPMAPHYGMTQNMRHLLSFYATHFGVQFSRDGADPKFGRGFSLFCPEL